MRFDFMVLGSGPAGRRAAVKAAKLGKPVLVIDNRFNCPTHAEAHKIEALDA